MKKTVLFIFAATTLFASCEVEDIKIERVGSTSTKVHGLANCRKGEVLIKLYDDGNYVDNHRAVVREGVFNAFFFKQPRELSIKYSSKEW